MRRAETLADYRACQDAQRSAWGLREESYVVPIATMVGANLHGGLVLGAFLDGGQAVALSFGFLGRLDGRHCLYSQLTGVIPGYQSLGLGLELKRQQREIALGEGLALVAWAFDPLQAGNASFNLQKLGARVSRYVDNMYGERTDSLSAGVPTDRLIAEWETAEARAQTPLPERSDIGPGTLLVASQSVDSGYRIPSLMELKSHTSELLIEIPSRVGDLRRERPELAEEWRKTVRAGFLSAFASGYQACGFVQMRGGDEVRSFYRLAPGPAFDSATLE